MKNVNLKFYEIIKSMDLNIKHVLMDILILLFDRCLALRILLISFDSLFSPL